MPGLVVAHCVEVGDRVATGDAVAVVETMKCEWPVHAEEAGVVTWLADLGHVLAAGDDLIHIRAVDSVRPPAPDEVADLLTGATAEPRLSGLTSGAEFIELDLDPTDPSRLVEVPRGRPSRQAGIMVGLVSHELRASGPPVRRVWLCGDSTMALGAVSEPECARIIAAIDLAEEMGLPLEWVAVSSGARISMTSGTENMDWCAAVVRRLVEFTQLGGEVLIIVAGINVGAQSYWNAEATMLMHCAGLLVMIEGTAMVLTGHRALAQAGGVSERSDHALGGTPVMMPNGEAHHRAADLTEALRIVLSHHALCAHGPEHPLARMDTLDPADRDVCDDPYDVTSSTGPGHRGVSDLGDVLHAATNPQRTRPFAIEPVMAAVSDRDAPQLRRWEEATGASGAHVWDTRVDGWPVSLIGIDARPRLVDDRWEAAGTLYPEASRKVARGLNHASGRRPAVVLANLAGFDGSRESLMGRQLEFGAELARSVVNFTGPLVVVVIGRFHGGAYVVLNRRLNPELRIVALEGTRVSVIGGTAAAEVVLRRRVKEVLARDGADADDSAAHRAAVSEVAAEFDSTHDVHRAAAVGSVDRVISPQELRPVVASLIGDAVRGRVGPAEPIEPGDPVESGLAAHFKRTRAQQRADTNAAHV
ncbi:MAG: carboxyl transferase domain-containing protein [Microthrixaceae bacterium]